MELEMLPYEVATFNEAKIRKLPSTELKNSITDVKK